MLKFFSFNSRDNLDSFGSGAVSEASFLRGEKRSLVSLQVCYTASLLEYIAIASTAISILLGLYDINIPNIHFLDAIITSIVIPFIHILNDENTKGIILEHGWIKGISYTLGMYVPPTKEKQTITFNTTEKKRTNEEMLPKMTLAQPLTESQKRILCRKYKSCNNLLTNQENRISNERSCLKRYHSLGDITSFEQKDDHVVYELQKPLFEPNLSIRIPSKPINCSVASDNSSISTILLEN